MTSERDPQPEAPAADTGVAGEVANDRYLGETDLTSWRTTVGRMLARLGQILAARVGPYGAFLIQLGIGGLFVVLLSVAAGEIYDAVIDADGVSGIDHPLLETALALRHPVAEQAVTAFTDLAGTVGMPLIAVTAILVLAIRRRSWTPVILIVAAGAGSLLITVSGKELIARERPPLASAVAPFEESPSFPSGHTLNAVAVVGIIAYLLMIRRHSRRARVALGAAAVVFAVAVGLSRVYLGHHWFTDVLVGWALGAAWLSLVITAHRLYLTVRGRHHHDESGRIAAWPL